MMNILHFDETGTLFSLEACDNSLKVSKNNIWFYKAERLYKLNENDKNIPHCLFTEAPPTFQLDSD